MPRRSKASNAARAKQPKGQKGFARPSRQLSHGSEYENMCSDALDSDSDGDSDSDNDNAAQSLGALEKLYSVFLHPNKRKQMEKEMVSTWTSKINISLIKEQRPRSEHLHEERAGRDLYILETHARPSGEVKRSGGMRQKVPRMCHHSLQFRYKIPVEQRVTYVYLTLFNSPSLLTKGHAHHQWLRLKILSPLQWILMVTAKETPKPQSISMIMQLNSLRKKLPVERNHWKKLNKGRLTQRRSLR